MRCRGKAKPDQTDIVNIPAVSCLAYRSVLLAALLASLGSLCNTSRQPNGPQSDQRPPSSAST